MKLDQSCHKRRDTGASWPQSCLGFCLDHDARSHQWGSFSEPPFPEGNLQLLVPKSNLQLKQSPSKSYTPKMCLSMWWEGRSCQYHMYMKNSQNFFQERCAEIVLKWLPVYLFCKYIAKTIRVSVMTLLIARDRNPTPTGFRNWWIQVLKCAFRHLSALLPSASTSFSNMFRVSQSPAFWLTSLPTEEKLVFPKSFTKVSGLQTLDDLGTSS